MIKKYTERTEPDVFIPGIVEKGDESVFDGSNFSDIPPLDKEHISKKSNKRQPRFDIYRAALFSALINVLPVGLHELNTLDATTDATTDSSSATEKKEYKEWGSEQIIWAYRLFPKKDIQKLVEKFPEEDICSVDGLKKILKHVYMEDGETIANISVSDVYLLFEKNIGAITTEQAEEARKSFSADVSFISMFNGDNLDKYKEISKKVRSPEVRYVPGMDLLSGTLVDLYNIDEDVDVVDKVGNCVASAKKESALLQKVSPEVHGFFIPQAQHLRFVIPLDNEWDADDSIFVYDPFFDTTLTLDPQTYVGYGDDSVVRNMIGLVPKHVYGLQNVKGVGVQFEPKEVKRTHDYPYIDQGIKERGGFLQDFPVVSSAFVDGILVEQDIIRVNTDSKEKDKNKDLGDLFSLFPKSYIPPVELMGRIPREPILIIDQVTGETFGMSAGQAVLRYNLEPFGNNFFIGSPRSQKEKGDLDEYVFNNFYDNNSIFYLNKSILDHEIPSNLKPGSREFNFFYNSLVQVFEKVHNFDEIMGALNKAVDLLCPEVKVDRANPKELLLLLLSKKVPIGLGNRFYFIDTQIVENFIIEYHLESLVFDNLVSGYNSDGVVVFDDNLYKTTFFKSEFEKKSIHDKYKIINVLFNNSDGHMYYSLIPFIRSIKDPSLIDMLISFTERHQEKKHYALLHYLLGIDDNAMNAEQRGRVHVLLEKILKEKEVSFDDIFAVFNFGLQGSGTEKIVQNFVLNKLNAALAFSDLRELREIVSYSDESLLMMTGEQKVRERVYEHGFLSDVFKAPMDIGHVKLFSNMLDFFSEAELDQIIYINLDEQNTSHEERVIFYEAVFGGFLGSGFIKDDYSYEQDFKFSIKKEYLIKKIQEHKNASGERVFLKDIQTGKQMIGVEYSHFTKDTVYSIQGVFNGSYFLSTEMSFDQLLKQARFGTAGSWFMHNFLNFYFDDHQ